jgi:hypothetical protein
MGQLIWIAQASYDDGIELSASNELPTHHIAPHVDRERQMVGDALRATGLVIQEELVDYTTPIFFARNGGGDFYESDGDALAVAFVPIAMPPPPAAWSVGSVDGLKAAMFRVYRALVSVGPALGVVVAIVVVCLIGFLAYRSARRARSAKRQYSVLHT